MAGHFNNLPPVPKAFGPQPQFQGFMAPCRFEGEVNNLEIFGDVPKEISGTFYRVMPDAQFPNFIDDDPWFNGDGNISAFRIKDGHVDFQQRYVRTEKFVREAEARRALIGKYRNKYTDAVAFAVRSTANTNIVYWQGKLLALKEDSPPYSMNPKNLETIGLETFGGQLPSVTFTAHPKFDPYTREMVCFGYEARGDGTPDVCYYSINPEGKMTETLWFEAPYVGMIHDIAITKNYCLIPMAPHVCDLERMKKGGNHFQFDNELPILIGVIPRHGGKKEDVKWFETQKGFAGHVSNAYEDESGKLVLDVALSEQNVFFWWPDKDGKGPAPQTISSSLKRFVIDPKATNLKLSPGEVVVEGNTEFPRIDDRFCTVKHNKFFFSLMDHKAGTDFKFIMPVMGGGCPIYNTIGFKDLVTGKLELYFAGPRKFMQECIFIPRQGSTEEADGYVMSLVNNYESMSSELVILDTKNFTKEVALIKLPLRLRAGIHGNWVDDADVDGHPSPI